MKIAIDCRSIADQSTGKMAGIGHYTYHVVRHLLKLDKKNHYVLFFDEDISKSTVIDMIGGTRNAEVVRLQTKRGRRLLPYVYAHRIVAKGVAGKEPDLFHAPSGSLPLGYKGRSVITVHDLAIYLHPEWFPGGQFFSKRLVVPKSIRRADRIIAVSRSTKRDLIDRFAVTPEKIVVVHEGAEHHPAFAELQENKESILKKYKIDDRPYFLFLGTIEPRKNVDGLVRAFEKLAKKFPDLVGRTDLLLAGAKGWKSDAIFKEVHRANTTLKKNSDARVRHLGYVSAEEKAVLMAESVAFVFPTRYEGFGLPVLEAMSLGVPVITSDISSLPEITGRDGALLVDPEDPSELVLAMKHLLEDPDKRAALGRAGMLRSTEFRWERAAGETLEVYKAAARGEKPRHIAADLRAKWIDDTLFDTPHRPL